MPPRQKTDAQLRKLHAQGLSPTEIARRLKMPRSTVSDRLKKLGLSRAPAPESPPGVPQVHNGLPEGIMDDLAELVDWWRERTAARAEASDGTRQTARTTFHVERRWLDQVRRQADLDRTTQTWIVNEAFRQYFATKDT